MPGWKVHTEEKDHFVVSGNAGDFRIHKGNLSPAALASMQKMCKGGKAKNLADGGKVKADEKEPADKKTTPPPNSSPSVFDASKKVQGHNARLDAALSGEGMAEGGPVSAEDAEQGRALKSFLEDPRSTEAAPARQTAAQFEASLEPTPDNTVDPTLPPAQAPAQASPPAPPAERPYAGPMARPPDAPAASSATEQASRGVPFPSFPRADYSKSQGLENAAQAQGAAGADALMAAEKEKSAAAVKYLTDYNQKVEAVHASAQAKLAEAQQRIDKVTNDIATSKIDPGQFWSSKDSWQKAAAGIGMILSGIGSGLSGQPNMAAQFIQRSIDRDIESQKANLQNKHTLLGELYHRYGNIQEAEHAARSYLTASLAGQAGLAEARAGDKESQARNQLFKSQLASSAVAHQFQLDQAKHQDALARYQMEFQRNLMSLYGSGGGQGGNGQYIPSSAHPPMPTEFSLKGIEEMRKDDNDRRVNLPDVGPGAYTHAQTPKDAAETKQTLGVLSNLDSQVDRLAQLAKQHSVAIHVPGSAPRATYESYASSLLTELNKLQGLNRLNENEYKEFGNIIPAERELLSAQGSAKLDALKQHIQAKRLEEYRERLGLRMGQRPAEGPPPGAR